MRFGHASREMLRTLQRSGDIRADEYFEEASMPSCYACDAGAMRRKPSPGAKVKEGYSRSWEPGELLVMDMIPLEATALGGTNSMLVAVDSNCRYIHVKFLKNAGELLPRMKEIISWYGAHKRMA